MRARKWPRRSVVILGIFAIGLITMASDCEGDDYAANPTSMCSVVLGDGKDDHDSKIHEVVYPNENPNLDTDTEIIRYFPCNSRNFIVNPAGITDANGKELGDRHSPAKGFVGSTEVNAWLSAYWTPNQQEDAMRRFYELCDKYKCASDVPESGDANFSTPGWNGLLGENFGTALDDAFALVISRYDDSVWKTPNPALNQKIATEMEEVFDDAVRAKTGYGLNLFCGSGNSEWPDPERAGEGDFTCTNVRIEVDKIFPTNDALQKQANEEDENRNAQEVNASRLAAAKAQYGDLASYWLGLQDTIDRCNDKATCIFSLGGQGTPTVPVPTPTK